MSTTPQSVQTGSKPGLNRLRLAVYAPKPQIVPKWSELEIIFVQKWNLRQKIARTQKKDEVSSSKESEDMT